MVVAHLGVAVSLAGMASETGFIKEVLIASDVGESHKVGPYDVKFAGLDPVAGPNWTALEATLEARRGGGEPLILKPQSRMFSNPPTETNEAAIRTVLDGQLYLVLGKQEPSGRWQLRMWWKPLVTLIWLGGARIAFGGRLALDGTLNIGAYSVLVFMTQRLLWPLTRLGETFDLYQRAMASTTRILDLLEVEPQIVDGPRRVPVESVRGEVTFEDVHFNYGNGQHVVRGLSLHIPAGETAAIVGATGAGKSTVIKLLLRFYDVQRLSLIHISEPTRPY